MPGAESKIVRHGQCSRMMSWSAQTSKLMRKSCTSRSRTTSCAPKAATSPAQCLCKKSNGKPHSLPPLAYWALVACALKLPMNTASAAKAPFGATRRCTTSIVRKNLVGRSLDMVIPPTTATPKNNKARSKRAKLRAQTPQPRQVRGCPPEILRNANQQSAAWPIRTSSGFGNSVGQPRRA